MREIAHKSAQYLERKTSHTVRTWLALAGPYLQSYAATPGTLGTVYNTANTIPVKILPLPDTNGFQKALL